MTDILFKHNDSDCCHDKTLTLHDCISDKVCFSNGSLRFFLPDGLWVTTLHNDNNLSKTVKTNAAVVDFYVENLNDIEICVFTRTLFGRTKVKTWDIHTLMNVVNEGECTVEFVNQYRTHFEQMWQCVLHSKKRPHYRECQLYLPKTEAVFRWNELQSNHEW